MKKFTLSLLLFTITFCTLIGLISNININAAETNDNFTVSMVDGAQIRTVEPNGIKFIGKVTGTVTGNDVKYGIVFGQGTVTDLTHETKDRAFAEVTSTTEDGEFYVTMIKFPKSAYTMNITARAYVKVDGVYYYSELSVTRNLGDLAVAYSKTDGYVAEENPLIENILSVLAELDETNHLVFDNGLNNSLDLTTHGDVEASGCDGAIYVTNGSTLTIDGNATVTGVEDQNYAMAVWAKGEATKVIINGGIYTQSVVSTTDDQFDLIYASVGATIEINGGTFKSVTPKWTLNLKDNTNANIVVKGGEFFEFDPSKAQTEPGTELYNYVAFGYKVTEEVREDGTWYVVEKDENIVLIEDLEDLKAFRDAVNAGDNHATKKVYLMNDIDLANEEWIPIGNASTQFSGNFYGRNNKISNLKISNGEYGALFGYIKNDPSNYLAGIEDLTIENANVTGVTNGAAFVAGMKYSDRNTWYGGVENYHNLKLTGDVIIEGVNVAGITGSGWADVRVNVTDITVDVNQGSYIYGTSRAAGAFATLAHADLVENVYSNIDVIGEGYVGGVAAGAGWTWNNITCDGNVTLNTVKSETGKYNVATVLSRLEENTWWTNNWWYQTDVTERLIKISNLYGNGNVTINIYADTTLTGEVLEVLTDNGYASQEIDTGWYSEFIYTDGVVKIYTASKIYDDGAETTLTLNSSFTASGYDGAIYVTNGSTLTIDGSATVTGVEDQKYAMAVWAKGEATKVIINSGIYTQSVVSTTDDQFDLIYASVGATIEINGGTFKSVTPKWTLNLKDNTNANIVVKGGEFFEFDPSNAYTELEQPYSFVPEGYYVVKEVREDGTWYVVEQVVVAKIGEICYSTFEDAILNAHASDIVEVIDNNVVVMPENATAGITVLNATFESSVKVSNDITFDNCAFNGNDAIITIANGNVTIKNSIFTDTKPGNGSYVKNAGVPYRYEIVTEAIGIAKVTEENNKTFINVHNVDDLWNVTNVSNQITEDGLVDRTNVPAYDMAGVTINILSDLDMGSRWWRPISQYPSAESNGGFKGIINGNNHIITNFKTSGNRTVNNSTMLDNGWGHCQGFIGIAGNGAVIKDITFKDAYAVSQNSNVGIIVGLSCGGVTFENCHVIDVKHIESNYYMAGIVGPAANGDVFKGCTVKNLDIYSWHTTTPEKYSGAIYGSISYYDHDGDSSTETIRGNITIENCSWENVNVIVGEVTTTLDENDNPVIVKGNITSSCEATH